MYLWQSVYICKQAEAEVVPSSSSVKVKLNYVKLSKCGFLNFSCGWLGGWVLKMKLMLSQLSTKL